jgi:Protein of unknown function DUF86
MSDDASRAWQFYIDDMIGFADKVIAYTNGLDQDRFIQNGLNYDATLRNLELIGEAARTECSAPPTTFNRWANALSVTRRPARSARRTAPWLHTRWPKANHFIICHKSYLY